MEIINSLPQKIPLTEEINKINEQIGENEISDIGDGTITGAISTLNTDLTTLSVKKMSALVETPITVSSVTIPAGAIVDVTATFTTPSECHGNPIIGYVKSTGWAGLIPQGISRTGNKITATIYNASTVSRTVAPIIVGVFASYTN